jgi:ankyrin repeat protein
MNAKRYIIMIYTFMVVMALQCCNSSLPQNYQTTLKKAAYDGDIVTLERLLKQGADPDTLFEIGTVYKNSTALHIVASNGHLEAVKLLVERGAKIDHGDSLGNTALVCAVRGNHYSVTKYLLDHGASMQISKMKSFLIGHVLMGNSPILNLLLEHGMDPNLGVNSAVGPVLSEAVRLGHTDVVRALLKAGADLNARTGEGVTALQCAQLYKFDEIAGLLKSAGAQ